VSVAGDVGQWSIINMVKNGEKERLAEVPQAP
jgi:hypothetical protein